MKLNKTITGVLIIFAFSCANKNSNVVKDLFPHHPDTSSIPEVINFVNARDIEALIDEETTLSNGKKRYIGIKAVPQNGDDFRRVSLDEIYWPKTSIVEGDFRGSSIRSARCHEGDYSKSDFRAADIRWSLFDHSKLEEVNFSQSHLFHVHTNYSKLSDSNFRGANMFGMEGHFATLRNCDFSGALMKDAEFLEADFTGSVGVKTKLFRAVLKDSKIDSCDFSFADFTGAGLEGSSFIHSRLWHANFQGSHLQGCNFNGADLKGCNFFGAELESTNFNGASNIPKEIKGFIDENGYATGIWQDSK